MNRLLLICLSIFSFTFVNWQISKAEDALCSIRSVTRTKREDTIVVKEKLGSDPDHTWGEAVGRATPTESVLTQICNVVELRAGLAGGGGSSGPLPAPRRPTNLQQRTSVNLTTRQTLSFSYEDCAAIGPMPDPRPSSPPAPGHLPVGPTRVMEQCVLAANALNAPPRARGPNVPNALYRLSLSTLTGLSPRDLEPWIDGVVNRAAGRIAGLVPNSVLKALFTTAVEASLAPAASAALAYTQAVVVPAGPPTMVPSTGSGPSVILYSVLKPVALSSDRPGTVGKVLKTVGIGSGFNLELTAEVMVMTQVTGRDNTDLDNKGADLLEMFQKINSGSGFDDVIDAFGHFYVKVIFNADIRTPGGWGTAWGNRKEIPRYGLDVIFKRGSDGKIHPEILQHGPLISR